MGDSQRNLMKNVIKNSALLLHWSISNESFSRDLNALFSKWPSDYKNKKPLGHVMDERDPEKIKKKSLKAYKQGEKFREKLSEKEKASFYKDIDNFLLKHSLGKEWFPSIEAYIISGWIYPPTVNFHTTEEGKRVVLVLNPDTSLEDIKDIWPSIKEEQKELWPDYERVNYSKKMFRNLNIALQDMEERTKNGGIEWDEAKQKNYKLQDKDYIARIWKEKDLRSSKAQNRKVAQLRQIRKRNKAK